MKGRLFLYCNERARRLVPEGRAAVEIPHAYFPDHTPNIVIPRLEEAQRAQGGAHLVYYSYWETMEEKKMEEIIIFVLADTRNVASLVVVTPYDPLATMERVTQEGCVATANVDAHFWKTLPLLSSGRKVHRLIYDHHTLQNRFYFTGGNTQCVFLSALDMRTAHSLIVRYAKCVAFPDDGAHKRFGKYFPEHYWGAPIVCAKTRTPDDKRVVRIAEGNPRDKHVIIVDDLVRTGGTLAECFRALIAAGASRVSFFVTHGQFPARTWERFLALRDEHPDHFGTFIITDSVPTVADEIEVDHARTAETFRVIPLRDDIWREVQLVQSL